MLEPYNKCDNPACRRKVKVGVAYCCTPCWQAHDGGYEIHPAGSLNHSGGCDQRMTQRGGPLPAVQQAPEPCR